MPVKPGSFAHPAAAELLMTTDSRGTLLLLSSNMTSRSPVDRCSLAIWKHSSPAESVATVGRFVVFVKLVRLPGRPKPKNVEFLSFAAVVGKGRSNRKVPQTSKKQK